MFTSDIIKRALAEDLGHGDLTSDALVPKTLFGTATIRAKEKLVVCGLGVAIAAFIQLDGRVKIEEIRRDGDEVQKGEDILKIQGRYHSLLKAERVALNFLQRLSGIATLTRRYVDAAKPYGITVLDTRKTTPMLRHLEKYAVRIGGGQNHRLGLYDGMMIKENHVMACEGNLGDAVRTCLKKNPKASLVVEVERPSQVEEAIEAGARHLLLDNMLEEALLVSVTRAKKSGVKVEVSGGIQIDQLEGLGELGVDFVSVGALTHSVPAVDLSLLIEAKT